ncbi:MAG: archaemetzincin family Zn-dependent metalloprotease [Blastocatellia bacterium]|nr:archaemetzincin family Zn-dependent metalloprotease [Blastocatellia bacterium]
MQLLLISIHHLENYLLDSLKTELENFFDMKITLKKDPQDLSHYFNPQRQQYNATKLLAHFKKSYSKHPKILLITNQDIYSQGLTYVFGQAEVDGKIAIISTARLQSTHLLERALKEAIHEIGHLLSLEHCMNRFCVMQLSKNTQNVDRKPARFCANCSQILAEKLYLSTTESHKL